MIKRIWLEVMVARIGFWHWWHDQESRAIRERHKRWQAVVHETQHTDGGVPSCNLCYRESRA